MLNLQGFIKTVTEASLCVEGVHVYSEAHGVVQHVFTGGERRHIFSGSKAFTSMGVGIAVKECFFNLTDRVLDFFPEYKSAAADGSENITLRDLLQMRCGHGDTLFFTDLFPSKQYNDWAELFFKLPMTYGVGERSQYDNGCTYMLGRVIEKCSGLTLKEYLEPRLFAPLGINDVTWDTDPAGHSLGAIGLHLTTAEYACMGRLLLQNGQWEGKEIVPSDYVQKACTDIVPTEHIDPECTQGYGYQLWRCTYDGAFRADGKYGQFSIVLPELRAVVTTTSRCIGNANDILRAVWANLENC